MPTNHGIYRKRIEAPPPDARPGAEEIGVFRNGISQIFQALATVEVTPSAADRTRAIQLEFHYQEVFRRFLFSLQHLNLLTQAMAADYNQNVNQNAISKNLRPLGLEAGCQADHILTYLNSIVDDLACAIIHATGYVSPNPTKPIDSMGALKSQLNTPALSPVAALLAELDSNGSWWELAFKPRIGGRQLLIHNHYFVKFQGSAAEGQPVVAQAFLITPFEHAPIPNFLDLLRGIFASLFDWLDRLEAALTAHLRNNFAWVPSTQCRCDILPIGYPPGVTHFHPDYFMLPLCDGSDPLPWTVTVSPDLVRCIDRHEKH